MTARNVPGSCVRELAHRFDSISGWCANCCGWRDDGQSSYHPRSLAPVEPPTLIDITEPRRSGATP